MSRSAAQPYVDLHAHVLPGVDDGPPSLQDALALLQAMQADGATAVVATSHVSTRYPNDGHALARAREALSSSGDLPITVLRGAEVELSLGLTLQGEALADLCLGDTRWLLIETPHARYPASLPTATRRLRELGFEVLLAHPERNAHLQRDARLLREAIDAGGVGQLTCGSLRGTYGRRAQRAAYGMLEAGLAHVVATDAHDVRMRPPDMTAAATVLARRYGARAVEILTRSGPSAIIAGESSRQIPVGRGDISRRRRWLPGRAPSSSRLGDPASP